MTVRPSTTGVDERLDLLDALVYADVFDCALTLDELWRYSRVAIEPERLARRLRDDPAVQELVVQHAGLYCLAHRANLIDERVVRIRRARALQRRAGRLARALRHVPFVRGVALTGSTAADDASEDADLDLVVIAARQRLGTVFLLLASASRLLGRRVLCPNYYVSEDHLEIAPSLYDAHEIAQAHSLVGDAAGTLRDRNRWLTEMLPNAAGPKANDHGRPAGAALQRTLEVALAAALGDRLERWARRLAAARLRAHHGARGEAVPSEVASSSSAGVALRFHGGRAREVTVERYAARRAELATVLDHLDGEPPDAHVSRAVS